MNITARNHDILQDYMDSIQQYETLSFEEEQNLARDWVKNHNRKAAHTLANSHLRLVVKVAISFKGYGLPMSEVIQEGNMGLIHAITRFDPNRGFRLSTYAMWWIRASIQEYVLSSWSLVKIGTTSAQKKLFFNLRKMRNKLNEMRGEALSPEAIKFIASELDVKPKEVVDMDLRLTSNDQSLNANISNETEGEWIDWLIQDTPTQEEAYSDNQIKDMRRSALHAAIERLDEREKEIFISRRLMESENSLTLEDLSQRFKISRERVRQIEVRAFNKLKKLMTEAA